MYVCIDNGHLTHDFISMLLSFPLMKETGNGPVGTGTRYVFAFCILLLVSAYCGGLLLGFCLIFGGVFLWVFVCCCFLSVSSNLC